MKKGLLLLFLLPLAGLFAREDRGLAVHAGLGTDLNLGLGLGVKASLIPAEYGGHPLEVGAELFYSRSVELSSNGINDYTETTTLLVFGVLANWLVDYDPGLTGFYYILGAGAAGVSVEWLETSDTDTSLGEPYGTSGSQQSLEGTTGALILNPGVAYNWGNGFDLRLELPIMIFFSQYGTSALAPALTLMGGYRF